MGIQIVHALMGYAYKFIIYSGKDSEPMLENETDVGTVGNVVIKLARAIPRRMNHIVYFDNFYTSLPLMYYMAKQGIWCLGIVQRNRLGKSYKLPTNMGRYRIRMKSGTLDYSIIFLT